MVNFETALAAAREGKQIRHKTGLNKWLTLTDTSIGFRLTHSSGDFGFLFWIPHQWEILDDTWEIK
jgi:hypothetical protein